MDSSLYFGFCSILFISSSNCCPFLLSVLTSPRLELRFQYIIPLSQLSFRSQSQLSSSPKFPIPSPSPSPDHLSKRSMYTFSGIKATLCLRAGPFQFSWLKRKSLAPLSPFGSRGINLLHGKFGAI